jgi:uncharacterized protein YciI
MHFIIHCTDKPDSANLRAINRPAHIDFIEKHRDRIFVAGPTLTEDGENMNGSLLVVNFPSLADANTFAASDPYANAGLFESVIIKPWKMVFEPKS